MPQVFMGVLTESFKCKLCTFQYMPRTRVGEGARGFLFLLEEQTPPSYLLLSEALIRILSEGLKAQDREGDLQHLWHVAVAVTASRLSHEFSDRDRLFEQTEIDKWNSVPGVDLHLEVAIRKWRHWRPGHVSGAAPRKQRELERALRQKRGERLFSHLLPVAARVPYIAAVISTSSTVETVALLGEFLDLFGDARFRTIRVRCRSLEEVQRMGMKTTPWREADVRDLLNTMRYKELTPSKVQQVCGTLKWCSQKFGTRFPAAPLRRPLSWRNWCPLCTPRSVRRCCRSFWALQSLPPPSGFVPSSEAQQLLASFILRITSATSSTPRRACCECLRILEMKPGRPRPVRR